MRSLEQLDKWIAGRVRAWTTRVAGAAPPRLLELRRDILEDIRDHIEPKGEGRSVFPWDQITVRLWAQYEDQAELWQAAFTEENALENDVRDLLREAGCAAPAGLTVTVISVEDEALAHADPPFQVDYSRHQGETRAKPATPARPPAKLTVIRGEAEPHELVVAADRVNIGRLQEVFGDRDGLRRRNDIAFADTETSVSREHAHIRYDADAGHFRLHDSGSQRGTSIFREGRRLEVPKGNPRGVQLHSGDEINVGSARLRFELI